MAKEILILAPMSGKVIELSKVDDEVFAGEMVGKGFAITPDKKTTEVLSPLEKGKIKMAFEGGHAYGVVFKKIELLIHIGLDTVNLKGEGFDQKVSEGDKVKKDTVLTNVDISIIKKKAKSTDTMVLVTNETIGDLKIEKVAGDEVKAGEVLYKLVK